MCAVGPLIDISPLNVAYQEVQPSDAPDIIGSLTGAQVSRLLLPTDQPFFSRQKKIVLENCGIIEPERIESYIAVGASRGDIYVRAEYPLAVERFRRAIKQAKQLGILGKNIFNTPFAFDSRKPGTQR